MHTLACVVHGFLVSAIGHCNALHADCVTRGVHHDEHVFQSAVFLAHQETGSAAVVAVLQHCGRAGFDAEFVFDADAMHIIARAQGAVLVHQKFRHHEQADAFDAFRRAADARQHQVHDVVGHVVFTVGDVDFGTEHFVSAVGLRLGARTHQRQIGTGLRFGQVHGACPFAADQFVQVRGFQIVAACGQQSFNGAVCQQRTQRKTQARRIQHFHASRAYGFGQTLAAAIDRVLQTLPAAF